MAVDQRGRLASVALVTDAQEPLHRLSVEDYHRMIEVGILTEDDRVELLEGAIIEMSPEGPPHSAVLARLTRHVVRGLDDDSLIARIANPMVVPPSSVPEPDVAVVDAASSTFQTHPGSAHLAIEVAYSSRRKDLERKARVYASAGVREYWVVDLVELAVHVHLTPHDLGYAVRHTVAPPALLRATHVRLPALSLADLFADD